MKGLYLQERRAIWLGSLVSVWKELKDFLSMSLCLRLAFTTSSLVRICLLTSSRLLFTGLHDDIVIYFLILVLIV